MEYYITFVLIYANGLYVSVWTSQIPEDKIRLNEASAFRVNKRIHFRIVAMSRAIMCITQDGKTQSVCLFRNSEAQTETIKP